MGDAEVLDMLFDSSSGILNDQFPRKQQNSDTNMLFSDKQLELEMGWSSNSFVSQLADLDDSDLFASLLETNLPDDAKQKALYSDHAYYAASSPGGSDSGVSTGGYSPSSSNNSIEDIIPMDMEKELFGPLNLKNYEGMDSMEEELTGIDPYLLDSLSDASGSPGLIGNESPINFDFEDDNPSVMVQTSDKTKVIKVLSVNNKTPGQQSLLANFKKTTQVSKESQLPKLMLADEEKELLRREGITLPEHLPLTREEEKILRSVRRRIRNKASARNSRRKKQDYMEALEQRVKLCTDEKRQLEKKVGQLEKQNSTLMGQLKKLQRIVSESTRHTAKTGTCAMILALSFSLILLPNFKSFTGSSADKEGLMQTGQQLSSGRTSRNLLATEDSSPTLFPTDSSKYFPFINHPKITPYSPVDRDYVHEPVDGDNYIHDPVDPEDYPSDDVIHMEITKLPQEPEAKINDSSPPGLGPYAPTMTRGRAIRMDLDDEL